MIFSDELEALGRELLRLGDAPGAEQAFARGATYGDLGANRCAYRLALLAADRGAFDQQ
jgi:hypothetical protein